MGRSSRDCGNCHPDAAEYGRRLYAALRDADDRHVDMIWIQVPPAGSEWMRRGIGFSGRHVRHAKHFRAGGHQARYAEIAVGNRSTDPFDSAVMPRERQVQIRFHARTCTNTARQNSNIFQRLARQWDELHPYNGAQSSKSRAGRSRRIAQRLDGGAGCPESGRTLRFGKILSLSMPQR